MENQWETVEIQRENREAEIEKGRETESKTRDNRIKKKRTQ